MPSIIGLYCPVEGFLFWGYSLYTRLLYGLVWLAMGLYARALYNGLYIVGVALLRGLVMLCACVLAFLCYVLVLWACVLCSCVRYGII